MSKNLLYTTFSIISYLLLLIKFPILLVFDDSFDNLSNYFIVISFSIGTNFITSDLLSYKQIDNGINLNEIIFAFLFFIISSSLIYYNYTDLFVIFTFFNISLFLNSLTISRLRQKKIIYLIYLEIIVSVFQLCFSILISKIYKINLGYSLIICTTLIYIFIFILMYVFKEINFHKIKINNELKIVSVNLYFDMIITQTERFLLSLYMPKILVYINIISSIINGFKRLIFDDNKMDYLIKQGGGNFNNIAVKYSTRFFLINIILFFLYQINFLESDLFLNLIRCIKPGYKIIDIKNLYFISALYFGVNPISFFVSHQFRHGKFKYLNYLFYFPILFFLTLILLNFIKIDANFLIILMTFTTLHFVLFFIFLSRKYYNISLFAFIAILTNYIFGYLSSLYYFF